MLCVLGACRPEYGKALRNHTRNGEHPTLRGPMPAAYGTLRCSARLPDSAREPTSTRTTTARERTARMRASITTNTAHTHHTMHDKSMQHHTHTTHRHHQAPTSMQHLSRTHSQPRAPHTPTRSQTHVCTCTMHTNGQGFTAIPTKLAKPKANNSTNHTQ
jgi:hypothetical protein